MSIPMKGNWNYPTRVWAGPGRVAELPKACEELGIVRPLIDLLKVRDSHHYSSS